MKSTHLGACFSLLLAIVAIETSCSSKRDSLRDLRNNWQSYIYSGITPYHFTNATHDVVTIPVRNNTDYVVDEVVVLIDYVRKATGIAHTEKVTVYNILPHSVKTVEAPIDGTSVSLNIMKALSTGMKFIYPGVNRNPDDPYLQN